MFIVLVQGSSARFLVLVPCLVFWLWFLGLVRVLNRGFNLVLDLNPVLNLVLSLIMNLNLVLYWF